MNASPSMPTAVSSTCSEMSFWASLTMPSRPRWTPSRRRPASLATPTLLPISSRSWSSCTTRSTTTLASSSLKIPSSSFRPASRPCSDRGTASAPSSTGRSTKSRAWSARPATCSAWCSEISERRPARELHSLAIQVTATPSSLGSTSSTPKEKTWWLEFARRNRLRRWRRCCRRRTPSSSIPWTSLSATLATCRMSSLPSKTASCGCCNAVPASARAKLRSKLPPTWSRKD
mmetsp:Transcript_5850/g.17446  ORF Transcript_5850/g.17446 Transcript_5850/m.17446 type:complete len:232 (-) Transcript_5850:1897-2592(-)